MPCPRDFSRVDSLGLAFSGGHVLLAECPTLRRYS
jgi:hypothetical protein